MQYYTASYNSSVCCEGMQLMSWCPFYIFEYVESQSHNLNRCWPRSLSTYGVAKLPWVHSYSIVVSDMWVIKNIAATFTKIQSDMDIWNPDLVVLMFQ